MEKAKPKKYYPLEKKITAYILIGQVIVLLVWSKINKYHMFLELNM